MQILLKQEPRKAEESVSADRGASQIDEGLVEALSAAYAELVKRQRTASAAFVRWTTQHARAHEFCWVERSLEVLMCEGKAIKVQPDDPLYASARKMMSTIELNPYERELLYGYPYLIGHSAGSPLRAPLFTMPVTMRTDGRAIIIEPNDENIRFNSLPFRSDLDSGVHEQALDRLIDGTPEFPLRTTELQHFCQSLERETQVDCQAALDQSLTRPPAQPRSSMKLRIVDCAACFVAPKTSYFITSDLEAIGRIGRAVVSGTALGWFLSCRGDQRTSNIFHDSRKVVFPFPSNASQRRVALLASEPDIPIIKVEGPPGTGKSLTIANVACHLVASGRRVLISSQRDKALSVVDETLRRLELPHLPMTLLRQDADSRRELRERLDSIQKNPSVEDTRRDCELEANQHARLVADHDATEGQLSTTLLAEHRIAAADREFGRVSTVLRRIAAG